MWTAVAATFLGAQSRQFKLHKLAPHHHQNSSSMGFLGAEWNKSVELSSDLSVKDDGEVLSPDPIFYAMPVTSQEIPKSFTSHMDKARLEMVFLRDRHNRLWAVKAAKVGGAWHFVDGWDKFVQDNALATADLLVFEYFSDRLFNVKMYGPNATEKNSVEPSEPMESQGEVSARVDAMSIGDDDVGPSRPVKKRGQVLAKANTIPIDDAGPSRPMKKHGQVSARADVDEENEDDEVVVLTGRAENEDREVIERQVNDDGAVGNGNNRLRHFHSRCYGMKIFEDGLAQQPTNPYFVTKIMPKRVADLFVPMDVLKDHNIRLGNEVTLVDPSGREFRSKCRVWGDQRTIISGGWKSICRVNNAAVEDACICEFLKREGDQRQFLNISFVRDAANIIFKDN